MSILGIENRTENWKTVEHFHGLSDEAKVKLVQKLGENRRYSRLGSRHRVILERDAGLSPRRWI